MVYDPEKHNRRSIRLNGYDYSQPGFYYITICTQDRIERFGIVEKDKMILNDAGEMVDAEWNRIPERYEHVVLDQYQIMPNHIHGILQITYQENGRKKSFKNRPVGRGLVPLLNENDESLDSNHNQVNKPNARVTKDGEGTLANGPINGNITHIERMGTRPIPTPLYDIIGTFKSLTQNEYADHVRNNGWPSFRKRFWQLRFHDHIIRNETEMNRIRRYIKDNPRNWSQDENNPVTVYVLPARKRDQLT